MSQDRRHVDLLHLSASQATSKLQAKQENCNVEALNVNVKWDALTKTARLNADEIDQSFSGQSSDAALASENQRTWSAECFDAIRQIVCSSQKE